MRKYRHFKGLKHHRYDKSKRYYLLVIDKSSNQEVLRHEVVIDNAFDRDFGFHV